MDGYEISTDPARLDRAAILRYLAEESYWARGRTAERMDRAIEHSLNFGLYAPDGSQAGYARVVSDRTTFGWLCDVFVLEAHRGRGLGKLLVGTVLEHPELTTIRQWHLGTGDAHELYRGFGFEASDPKVQMVRSKVVPDVGVSIR